MAFDKKQQYDAYNLATQTVPKIRQVVMLYDGAIRFTKQAKLAIEENRIEDRFNLLNKASEVLIGLQGALDFTNGGNVAPLLYDYYSSLDSRLIYVQRSNDTKILDSVITELKMMRGAWDEIDSKKASGQLDEAPVAAEDKAKSETSLSSNDRLEPTVVESDDSVFVSA